MIEKLKPRQRQDMNAYEIPSIPELVAKLNEVIEVVNAQERFGKYVMDELSERYPSKHDVEQYVARQSWPGSPPYAGSPVPEAEPQEQDDLQMPLSAAVFHFECTVRELEITSSATTPARHSKLLDARKRWLDEIFAAAHREYAQPTAASFSQLEKALDDFERLAQTEEVFHRNKHGMDKPEYLVKARAAVLAVAQPGKGV